MGSQLSLCSKSTVCFLDASVTKPSLLNAQNTHCQTIGTKGKHALMSHTPLGRHMALMLDSPCPQPGAPSPHSPQHHPPSSSSLGLFCLSLLALYSNGDHVAPLSSFLSYSEDSLNSSSPNQAGHRRDVGCLFALTTTRSVHLHFTSPELQASVSDPAQSCTCCLLGLGTSDCTFPMVHSYYSVSAGP